MLTLRSLLLTPLILVTPLLAQEGEDIELSWEEGRVGLGAGLATCDLPGGWSYLRDAEARFIVEDVWGNPEDPSVIGLITPPEDQEWGAIIVSYEEDGHVLDDDAAGLDYAELLESMIDDSEEENDYRRENGFETVELLGWAEPPHYDPVGKKLYWAKEIRFGGAPVTTLNYNVRILGREGVLVLNAVADTDQLAQVAAASKEILAVTEFTEGNRYEDYDPSVDRLAAYGIGGLIAGKALAKVGLFKAIGLFLVKGWKLVLVAVAAIGGMLSKVLKRS